MLTRNNQTHTRTTLLIFREYTGLLNSFLVVVCLLSMTDSHAQKRTVSEGLEELETIVHSYSSKKANKEVLDFLTAHQESEFTDEDNYYRFLQEADTFFNETQDYYPELLFFAGRKLLLSKRHQEAFSYLYKIELLIKSGNSYAFECEFHEMMGLSYFFFKRYEQSKRALNKSLECGRITEWTRINI